MLEFAEQIKQGISHWISSLQFFLTARKSLFLPHHLCPLVKNLLNWQYWFCKPELFTDNLFVNTRGIASKYGMAALQPCILGKRGEKFPRKPDFQFFFLKGLSYKNVVMAVTFVLFPTKFSSVGKNLICIAFLQNVLYDVLLWPLNWAGQNYYH